MSGAKEPATARGLLDATTDLYRIESWWGAMPDLNIAVATGAVSGFWVLDIDGEAGEASLLRLEVEHGKLPSTIEAITGKGRHLWFRMGEHGYVRNSAGQVAPGLDVRGSGGYVLVPPSIHPSGRAYYWSVDCAKQLADAPDWLYELIRPTKADAPKGKPLEHWHAVLTNKICSGERNTTLASICGKLLHCGVDNMILLADVVQCINVARCDEPLPKDEVDQIVLSVAKTYLRELGHGA